MKLRRMVQVCVCGLALVWASTVSAQGSTPTGAMPDKRSMKGEDTPISAANEWNRKVVEEFRSNEGMVGGMFANASLLLLHTTGAKSGLARLTPLAYMVEGARLVVIASNGGAPTSPDWYYNLVANPGVSVEVGADQFDAQATVAQEPERTQLYEQMVAVSPGFAEYRRKAAPRIIPVIVLTRQP